MSSLESECRYQNKVLFNFKSQLLTALFFWKDALSFKALQRILSHQYTRTSFLQFYGITEYCVFFSFFFPLLITNTRDLTQKPLGPSTIYTNKSKKQPVLGYSYDKDARIPRCLGLSSGSFSISKLLLLWFEPVVSAPLSSFRVLFA